MRKLFQNRRFFSLAIFGVIFLALLVAPTTTHAACSPLSLFCLDSILDGILSVVTVVKSLLGTLLDFAGKALKWSLSFSLEYILGLQVIDAAWRVVRDLANFVFIIMLVVISFSTILSVIPSLQKYHYSKALKGVIIAALLMNFSLAIGKTVVLAADQVARMVINIMPDLGDDLVKTLKPQVAILNPNGLAGPLSSDPGADVLKALTAVEDKRYKECLKEEVSITELQRVTRFLVNAPRSGPGSTPITTKGIGECAAEVQAARRAGSAVTAGLQPDAADAAAAEKQRASAYATTTQEKIFLIFSGLLSSLLILILTFCLITPFLFILLRILMLWILLFSSPIAWASYAVPGTEIFKKWWSLFLGWNFFAPVYLFAIIPGMIVLQGSGELLTGLSNGGVDISTTSGLFQIFMFHAFAVLIFLGGLAVAMKTSFAAGAVLGTPGLGWAAGKIGVGGTFGPAPGAARFASRITGATAAYESARARGEARVAQVKQGAKSIADRSRLFQAVKPVSYEEKLAAAKMRVGVLAGPKEKEFAEIKAGQVKVESDVLEKQMAGMTGQRKLRYLEERMTSKNPAVNLAAREQLLTLGVLTDDEITRTRKMYPTEPARQEFDKRVRRAAGGAITAKKKEAKEAREDLVAQISSKEYPDIAAVAAELGRLSDPADIRAAQEAIGSKDPMLLKDYLDDKGEPNSEGRAFAPVFKDSKKIVDLPNDYFTPGNAKMAALKAAINSTYRDGPAKLKLRSKLLEADPTRTNAIYDLTA